jgi:hypothetical protein
VWNHGNVTEKPKNCTNCEELETVLKQQQVELPNLMLPIISVTNSNQSQYFCYQGVAVYRGAQKTIQLTIPQVCNATTFMASKHDSEFSSTEILVHLLITTQRHILTGGVQQPSRPKV